MVALLREVLLFSCCLGFSVLGFWLFIGFGFVQARGPYQDWPHFLAVGKNLLATAFFMSSEWPLIWGGAAILYTLCCLKKFWKRFKIGKRPLV
jgi:hypothetical protein